LRGGHGRRDGPIAVEGLGVGLRSVGIGIDHTARHPQLKIGAVHQQAAHRNAKRPVGIQILKGTHPRVNFCPKELLRVTDAESEVEGGIRIRPEIAGCAC
jgi:hypothetical protein